ncbi:MAG: pitrilysin family protein [Spirochaetota bacterium]
MQRIIAYLLLLVVCSLPVMAEGLFQNITHEMKKDIKKVTLSNGLTLIMMRRTDSPTLALYTKFKVGSVDETPDIAGTSHMLEHMMFKGTKNIGTKNFAKEEKYHELLKKYGSALDKLRLEARKYRSIGAEVPEELNQEIKEHEKSVKIYEDIQKRYVIKSEDNLIYTQNGQVGFNAYTTTDVTNYQIQLPANRLELWAKIESDRLKNPILRGFYSERNVVMEERRMRVDNRGIGVLREKFIGAAFEQHPYRMPVIGYAPNIPYLDIYETKKYFRKFYSPNNMVIAIVGDLNFQETEMIVKRYFSGLQPSKDLPEIRTQENYEWGERRVTVKYPSSPIFMMGWHKPTFPHPDNSAFDVLDLLLTGGASSRLFKRLVLQDKLARTINAWNGDPGERYSNLFTIYTRPNSDADIKKLEAAIWEELERIKKGEIEQKEIDLIKNKLIASFFRGIDNNATLADLLSYYELITGDWANLFKAYENLYHIKPDDIQKVAKKYLIRENVTVGNLVDTRKRKKKHAKK